jgi:hypothetical protein
LGTAARQHILNVHTLEAGAARLETLIEKALRNHASRKEAVAP